MGGGYPRTSHTLRLGHSHRMIGVFRMIILVAGQIILNTRMIERDDETHKNVDF